MRSDDKSLAFDASKGVIIEKVADDSQLRLDVGTLIPFVGETHTTVQNDTVHALKMNTEHPQMPQKMIWMLWPHF
jgi:hypothetical protein